MKVVLSRAFRRSRRALQRGIVGVVALMFVIVVALFAMTQAANIAASNMTDSARQADAVEALFLAESAVERAGYLYVNSGTPAVCNDGAVGAPSGDFALGRGVYRILGSFTTDFDGVSTLPTTMCRVRVQGEITATRVTRTIDTIVGTEDDIISISSLNPNFNSPQWGCDDAPCDPVTETRDQDFAHPPDQWGLTGGNQGMAYIAWDKNGGPDGSRAAFARKTVSGSGTASSGGAFTVPTASPIVINVPKTLRLTFDFRVWTRGNSDQEMQFSPTLVMCTTPGSCAGPTNVVYQPDAVAAGGACDSNGTVRWCESGPTAPGAPRQSSGGQAPNGCGYVDTPNFESGVGGPEYNAGNCAGFVPPHGATGYETGYLTYTIPDPGGGQVQLMGIKFEGEETPPVGRLRGKDGQITWIWVDNLRLSVPAVSGGGPSKLWREVAAP